MSFVSAFPNRSGDAHFYSLARFAMNACRAPSRKTGGAKMELNREEGQGLVEYTLVLLLVLIVGAIVLYTLLAPVFVRVGSTLGR
jgi:prolipoprotein diacylglyceryltransferase